MGKRKGVRATSTSSIQIEFKYKNETCRERIKLPPTDDNLDFCARKREKIITDIALGIFDYAKEFPNSKNARKYSDNQGDFITIKQAIDEWLVEVSEPRKNRKPLERSTLLDYNNSAKFLIAAFGKKSLNALTIPDVDNWIEEQEYKTKRAKNIMCPLRGAYRRAKRKGYIKNNILADWSPSFRDADEVNNHQIDPLSPNELQLIYQAASPQIENLIKFAVWSGLRTSELIALQWDDVDFQRGIIHVNKAFVAGVMKSTKTEAGKRDVKLQLPAREALIAQKQFTYLMKEHIFHNPANDAPWIGNKPIRAAWKRILKRAEVRYRNPYQTRHTFASMMLSSGENPFWVSTQMGHADKSITLNTYSEFLPTQDQDNGSKAIELYNI